MADKDWKEAIEEDKRSEGEAARVSRKSLADFQRDTNFENTLLKGRWGVRGTISMHVSTTGSGKSILQTQSALCFNRGVPCCGLTPIRPFTSWVIQSEDDEDRVAWDRDDIIKYLAESKPGFDWEAAARETLFLDFAGITGAKFIDALDKELRFVGDARPDAVILNPLNAFLGGDPCSHRDCSAFLKGGELGSHETEGVEAVVKRHGIWLWMFSHTGKTPTNPQSLNDWINDPHSYYKACGSSALPDAVRSIITVLPVPKKDGVFTFLAGKNWTGLGWTDTNGRPTKQKLFRWGDDWRHYWQPAEDVEAEEAGDLAEGEDDRAAEYAEGKERALKTILDAIGHAGVEKPMTTKNVEDVLLKAGFPVRSAKFYIALFKEERREDRDDNRCLIEAQKEQERKADGHIGNKMRGASFLFTPELRDEYLRKVEAENA